VIITGGVNNGGMLQQIKCPCQAKRKTSATGYDYRGNAIYGVANNENLRYYRENANNKVAYNET
jgi:hypothetical protein